MRVDFPTAEIAHARARRERAEAVHALIVMPLVRFVKRLWTGTPRVHRASNRRAHA